MLEFYCFMCCHVWNNPEVDKCPECGCNDFMVNDSGVAPEPKDDDGHYEGGFKQSSHVYADGYED